MGVASGAASGASAGAAIGSAVPGVGTVVGAGAGAVLGGVTEFFSAKSANKQAKKSAQRQMDFTERMSNTAHQREVRDLKAAGLNPILSANTGASTPSGASYTPIKPDFAGAASKGVSTAKSISTSTAEKTLLMQQADLARATARRTDLETDAKGYELKHLMPAQLEKALAEILGLDNTAALQSLRKSKLGSEADSAKSKSTMDRVKRLMYEYGEDPATLLIQTLSDLVKSQGWSGHHPKGQGTSTQTRGDIENIFNDNPRTGYNQ
nr:MAG: DNA pilot protein [Microvirus sp.]